MVSSQFLLMGFRRCSQCTAPISFVQYCCVS